MSLYLCRFSVVLLFILSCALPLAAQNAAVQGVVADQSDALIPSVEIIATNVATGVVQKTETNEQGFYSIPFLLPGTYTLEASKSGFSAIKRDNLKLDVNQTARVDFALKVGTIAETIEVAAAATLLDSQTSVVGQVVDNKRIVELPLNGRNYLQLAQLTVGVTPDVGSRTNSKGTFSALGQRAYQTNVLLDGVDNNSRASGGQLGFEAQSVTPSIDAVQEFKVVTNNNSAEYGFRMGGTVIVQTKSGANEFHGSAYEFVRNEKFDGTNFFAVGQPKPPYRRNQFGATLGGRIIRDRTFFFGSFEGTRIRQGETNIATVPTAAIRSGDFTGQRTIYDPQTTRRNAAGTYIRDPFPGNIIPKDRFDPISQQVSDLYPLPNRAGAVSNHFFAPSIVDDTNQIDGRVDHSLSANHRLFARYSRRGYDFVDPGPLPLPADGGLWTTTTLTSNSAVGNWNATLSPSMNNELRFGFTRTDSLLDVPWTENYTERFGITGLPDLGDDNQRGMPRFTPAGYSEVGTRSFWPNRNNLDLYHIADHLMTVRGTHVLKTGFEYRGERLFRRAARFARGQFGFNGAFSQNPTDRGRTGDGMADFLLGLANAANIGNQNGETAVTRNYSLYFQDDWRIARTLTLNLGVRWDRFGPPSFRDTPVSRFEFSYGSQDYRIIRPEKEGDCGCKPDSNNFAPRVGLAWQATPKTVVRTGFGLYYGQPDAIAHDGDARFYHQPPDFTEISFPTDQLLEPALVVKNGFPPGLLPTTEIRENVTVRSAFESMPSQYSMQWFLDLQREIAFDTILTFSYIGMGARHLTLTRNIDQPLTPAAGAVKQRRPWPFFTAVNLREPVGMSNYQAFAAKAEKRYAQGFTLLASYTWSHSIDDGAGTLDDGTGGGGIRDAYNLSLNRGNSAYDIRQNFVAAAVYDLPVGKGKSWLNVSGPVDSILGGWQVGGILFLRTGRPYSVLISGDISNTGTQNFPNRIRDGELPSDERTIDRWFDTTAFVVPDQYTYGNSGRNILTGPGFRSIDLKFRKEFPDRRALSCGIPVRDVQLHKHAALQRAERQRHVHRERESAGRRHNPFRLRPSPHPVRLEVSLLGLGGFQESALFELPNRCREPGGMRIMRDHHYRLSKLLVQPRE